MLLALCTPALAAHPNDKAGGAPTGTFTCDILIVVDGAYKVGRRVLVELSGNASDTDIHVVGCTETTESDTFDAASAYKWVITDLTTTSPQNLTGKDVQFTTKNALGQGSIAMKVKDDGTHFQDFADNTQVASINVTIVDPDNLRIVSQDGSIITNNESEVVTDTTVVFQLTYSNMDLPWRGDIKEQYKGSVLIPFRNVAPPEPQTVTGDFVDLTTWYYPMVDNDGSFKDYHISHFAKPLPDSGKYHVIAILQRFKNLEADGAPVFGDTFIDYEYINSTPTFTHDEHVN